MAGGISALTSPGVQIFRFRRAGTKASVADRIIPPASWLCCISFLTDLGFQPDGHRTIIADFHQHVGAKLTSLCRHTELTQ